MTARDKILQAFQPTGTPEIGVVACYDSIFVRDHWFALTKVPWWHLHSGPVDEQLAWAQDYTEKSGLEWLQIHPCPSRAERARQRFEQRQSGMWIIDTETGEESILLPPTPSGTNTSSAASAHFCLDLLPATEQEVDALTPLAAPFDRETFLKEGRHDAAAAIRKTLDLHVYGRIGSPLWSLYGLLGYEGMMVFPLQSPHLAARAGKRIFQNLQQGIRMLSALGADAVWIEECLTDQISPALFRELNVPLLQLCIQEIRAQGMKSIYYYCGNPNDRLDAILEVGADAIHFEESKKGFTIDIADIVKQVESRCVVFGNLDSIRLLEVGSESELRTEVQRQLDAGKDNGNRFVISTGSPVTPGTSVERVRLYTDIVRELSKS